MHRQGTVSVCFALVGGTVIACASSGDGHDIGFLEGLAGSSSASPALTAPDATQADVADVSYLEAGVSNDTSTQPAVAEAGAVADSSNATPDDAPLVDDSATATTTIAQPEASAMMVQVGASTDASPTTTVASVPTIGGCALFPADNPWNTRIDDTTQYQVHPQSSTYISNMAPGAHLHADWGDWSTDHYGIPWQTVPANQALVPMTFQYSDESDPGPYPFPANALVEGGSGSGGDMHVLVVQSGTCMLYETWDSTYVGPGWTCGSGAKFNLGSDALRPDGWTSGDAAGLPILPGLIKVSEVQAGAIQHAIRFTVNNTQQGYIHPATHAAGSSNTNWPPMGLRLRLKASFDLSPFSGPALVILTAMKQYGLILADNGSNWFVSGDSNDAWTPLMDGITAAFGQVTGNDFEAVYTGPISTAGL